MASDLREQVYGFPRVYPTPKGHAVPQSFSIGLFSSSRKRARAYFDSVGEHASSFRGSPGHAFPWDHGMFFRNVRCAQNEGCFDEPGRDGLVWRRQ